MKFYIKELAKRRASHLRYGETIFKIASALYPKEASRSIMFYNCVDDDTAVDMFLDKLRFEIDYPLDTFYYVVPVYKKSYFYKLGSTIKTKEVKQAF